MADTEDTPCDVCRGTDYPENSGYSLCRDCWLRLTATAPSPLRILTAEEASAVAGLARLPRKQGHKDWCALTARRGTTCDCDWFEQEASGFGHGPPGHRAVVVPWPLPVLG
jgi:hypothetical protein